MKTNIEVEGGELALKNSHGDIVIIPKDKRTEVLELLEEDCYDCIDGIVDKLPVMSDYAEDGSLIPSWESVKAAVNPSNWGVEDYSEDGDFNNAFGEAKYNGLEEFMWNNKRYNTKTTMTPTQQMEEYGITDKQRTTNPSQTRWNLSELDTSSGYDITPSEIWKRSKDSSTRPVPSKQRSYMHAAQSESDALKLYMGMPQVNNTFTPSRYKDGAFELRGYNETLPDIMPSDDEINYYGQPLNWDEFEGFNTLKPMDDFVMGRHTVKSNSDERGSYIEYIDEFDFDTYKYKTDVGFPLTDTKLDINIPVGDMLDKTFGKPYSIYGRKYYKDYGDGVNRAMYYTDSELSDNTADKDTLGLQRELRNRGYEFPGSTKENGTLDGVMGDETKKALAEYQASQIKTKK